MDEVNVTAEIEAQDQLGMLVRRIEVRALRPGDIRKQAAAIVKKVDYLGCELKVIEVDGVSNAVQIRSKKPTSDGFIEVVLRGGNFLSFERRGKALHIARSDYEKLVRDLRDIL
jgi:hypothetical protein